METARADSLLAETEVKNSADMAKAMSEVDLARMAVAGANMA